jgi:aminoglycoside 3-N-acetyltransferase
MDSRAVWKTAELVAAELRDAKLDGVSITELPADGRTAFGGWLMPVFWTVDEARLETDVGGQGGEILADYAAIPQSLALYSPPTPHGDWVQGPVVPAPDAASVAERLSGSFLCLESGMGSAEINETAARSGALGVIVSMPNEDPSAVRYVNYAVPLDADRACVPCFSLSPTALARLRALLRDDPHLRLRARVRASRSTIGSVPLVTATLGQGQPEVYLCAHLDEPGAQDNASGVGVAIEALRALQAAGRHPASRPPLRAIRVFFSAEVRGLQAWVNSSQRVPAFMAGLNLDMVGCEPGPESHGIMGIRHGFPGQFHFAPYLLEAAARLADRQAGRLRRRTRTCGISDALVGVSPVPGHVSLEQTPGSTYHTSADVPDIINARVIHWSGVAATAFLHAATHLDNRQSLVLARRIARRAADDTRMRPDEAQAIHARAKAELASLRPILSRPRLFGDWRSPEELYRAGVRRGSGYWPAAEDHRRLDALIAALPAPRAGTPRVIPSDRRVRREAESLVPQVTFRGFLSFEDHTTPTARAELADALGLTPTWATAGWAWLLATRLRGKSTLAGVVDELHVQGVPVEYHQALALTRYLVKIGKARLRPILRPETLRRAFRGIGVRRGSVLCVQSSLSQFGYVPGGARTIIAALLDVLGPRGTLSIPTHSLSVLGAEPYDPLRSPSALGAVSEYFLQHPGVIRSAHPTHSVAAVGPAARALTHLSEPVSAPMARDGFWGRLYDAGGDVLLLCPIRSATILHVGEAWTGVPQPALIVHRRDARGKRRVAVQPQAPWHADHFQSTMVDPLLHEGVMRSAPMGDGSIFFAPARAMADISVAANRANPLVSLGRNGDCHCFYCQALRQGAQGRSMGDTTHPEPALAGALPPCLPAFAKDVEDLSLAT